MSEESIRNKTVKGVGWTAAESVAKYAVSFVVGIILARLLSPDDYGLIGLITIFIVIADSLIDSGFSSALIKKKDATDDDYNTVFIINLSMSVLLYVVLFLSAHAIAHFFERQELVSLIRVISVNIILGALCIVQRVQLTKSLDFKKQTKLSLIASVVSGILGIMFALLGFGVWALVISSISGTAIRTFLFWFYNRWWPSFYFAVQSFRELFGFGWKLLVSGLINTVWNEIYQVVIGKFYAPATLGQYSRATGFSNLFSTNLTSIVQRVSYPALSQIQDDRERLKNGYRSIIKTTMLVTFSCMLMLASVAKPMILSLIGEKWLQAASFLQIVCFSSMLYPLHAINLNMLQVQGRSDLFLKLEIIKKVIAVLPIMLGIFINIYWMLIGSVFVGIISYYLNAYYSGPFLNYSISTQIKDIMPSFTIALGCATVVYALSFIPCNHVIVFSIQLIVGVALLIIVYEKVKLPEYIEVKHIALSYMSNTKKLKKYKKTKNEYRSN